MEIWNSDDACRLKDCHEEWCRHFANQLIAGRLPHVQRLIGSWRQQVVRRNGPDFSSVIYKIFECVYVDLRFRDFRERLVTIHGLHKTMPGQVQQVLDDLTRLQGNIRWAKEIACGPARHPDAQDEINHEIDRVRTALFRSFDLHLAELGRIVRFDLENSYSLLPEYLQARLREILIDDLISANSHSGGKRWWPETSGLMTCAAEIMFDLGWFRRREMSYTAGNLSRMARGAGSSLSYLRHRIVGCAPRFFQVFLTKGPAPAFTLLQVARAYGISPDMAQTIGQAAQGRSSVAETMGIDGSSGARRKNAKAQAPNSSASFIADPSENAPEDYARFHDEIGEAELLLIIVRACLARMPSAFVMLLVDAGKRHLANNT